MAFNDEQRALIKEVAREVIAEYIPIIDERIKTHRLECSNGRYTKTFSAVIAVVSTLLTVWIKEKFFK